MRLEDEIHCPKPFIRINSMALHYSSFPSIKKSSFDKLFWVDTQQQQQKKHRVWEIGKWLKYILHKNTFPRFNSQKLSARHENLLVLPALEGRNMG